VLRSAKKSGILNLLHKKGGAAMFPGVLLPVIGLTGPTGAGKSTAARILAGLGCAVLDGDALAREITRPGSPVLQKLAARFGGDIICKGGMLDRKLLAERAFASEKSRRDLGFITHPAITELALKSASALQYSETEVSPPRSSALQRYRAIALDAAALMESDLAQYCDKIVVITAPEELRLRRVLKRDGISERAARQRIGAQSRMDYTGGAGHTITIDTTEGEAALQRELETFLEQILPLDGSAPAGTGAVPGGDLPPRD